MTPPFDRAELRRLCEAAMQPHSTHRPGAMHGFDDCCTCAARAEFLAKVDPPAAVLGLLEAKDALDREMTDMRAFEGRLAAKLTCAIADKVRAESRLAALAEALKRYGQHTHGCDQSSSHTYTMYRPCSCGFDAARGQGEKESGHD